MTDVVPPLLHRRSTSSSGGTSSRSVMDQKNSQGTATDNEAPGSAGSVGSACSRSSRKRAASINTEEANNPRLEELSLETPTVGRLTNDTLRDFICLCTPAPKVPRPRNAFILYRQHHQAQVVAQHPGLANPEISKIIGEQWREQADEVKEGWKKLAEEEKIRHQRQFPNYRYQPRRGARPGSRPGSASGEDPGRCSKCGGRFIATPRTPSTPFVTPTAAKVSMPTYITRDGRVFEADPARNPGPGAAGKQPVPYQHGNLRDIDEYYEPISPPSDNKRRRYNVPGQYQVVPSPGPYPHQPARQTRQTSASGPSGLGPGPGPGQGYGAGRLPGPLLITRSNSGPMAPPPPPRQHLASYAGPHRGNPFDESLRLPPLQTQIPPASSRDPDSNDRPSAHPITGLGISNPRDNHAQSVEAMVMTIPLLTKLEVLGTISPPLAPPGPGSPDIETRGAVIAIEGPDARLLEQVGVAVQRALLGSGEIDLKTWSDTPSTPIPAEEDAKMNDSSSASSSRKSSHAGLQSTEMFGKYMQTMMKWHEKSRQIVRHITTRPGQGRDSTPSSSRRASEGDIVPSRAGSASLSKIPVAILPGGFSLTIADKYACTIPIADHYAPVDHWHWTATLWRGIVGSDLLIYVKACTQDEVNKVGGVEFWSPYVMVVRIAHGKTLDEKTERRISFEVIEWIRGGSFREGFARD